jgi:hypothetical protein
MHQLLERIIPNVVSFSLFKGRVFLWSCIGVSAED